MGDEPTGKPKKSRTVFDIFKELKENFNQFILIVTHDMRFANKTDRIITLRNGASHRSVIQTPKNFQNCSLSFSMTNNC
jgi:ABC-type lipoprotein export system ATPase subunit